MRLETLTEYEVLAVNKPYTFCVSLEVGSLEDACARPRPPLGVLFLLDISSSMGRAPLEAARASVVEVCALLGEEDRVGLITFEAMAKREVPFELYGEAHRALLDRKLDAITPKPGTNMSDALVLARGVLAAAREREGERVVVLLLSDGVPSRGECELGALVEDARFIGKAGSLSTFDFGYRDKPRLLESMAEVTRGYHCHAQSPTTTAQEWWSTFITWRRPSLTDVTLTLTPREGICVHRVHGAREVTSRPDGALVLTLSDLPGGERARVLLELELTASGEVGQRALFDACVSGQDLDRGHRHEGEAVCEVTIGQETGARPAPILIDMFLFHARQEQRELGEQQERSPEDTLPALKQLFIEAKRSSISEDVDEGRRHHLAQLEASLKEDLVLVRRRLSMETQQRAREAWGRAPVSRPMLVCYVYHGCADGLSSASVHIAVDPHALIIGRNPSADVWLTDGRLSGRHACVFLEGNSAWIKDLGSTNGTLVGDHELEPGRPRKLAPGVRVQLTRDVWMWAWVCGGDDSLTPERRHVLGRLGRCLRADERQLLDRKASSTLVELALPMVETELLFREADVTSFISELKTSRSSSRLWYKLPDSVRSWSASAMTRAAPTSALAGEVRAFEAIDPRERGAMLSHLELMLSREDRVALGLECHAAMEHILQLADHPWPDEPVSTPRFSSATIPEAHETVLLWLAEQALVRRTCVGSAPFRARMRYEGTLVATLSPDLLTAEEQRELRPGRGYGPYCVPQYYLLQPLFDAPGVPHHDGVERSARTRAALDEARNSGALYVIFKNERWIGCS